MGKGDMKTKRGKISKGTFGVSRPRPSAKRRSEKAETAEPAKKKKPKSKK